MAVKRLANKLEKPAASASAHQRACKGTSDTTTTAQVKARALRWIECNPVLWNRFKDYATSEAEHKRRISVQWLIENVRKFDQVNDFGEPLKVDNSFSPFFARELIRECPQVRPFLKTRRSRFDKEN